jgi:preprotein translocase subunit SecA
MLYDTCELIIQDNKRANDFKTLNLTWFVTFLSHHRLLRQTFKADRNWINREVYKEALKYYQEKTERSAREAFPIIKNIR